MEDKYIEELENIGMEELENKNREELEVIDLEGLGDIPSDRLSSREAVPRGAHS